MLLADTSAWIEFLRGTGSAVNGRLRSAIRDDEVVVIDPIRLEVMAGARAGEEARLQRLLEGQHHRSLVPREDWLDAAWIYRHTRRVGLTVRSLVDCLIAAAAIRLEVPVLARDRDYAQIARIAPLELVDPGE